MLARTLGARSLSSRAASIAAKPPFGTAWSSESPSPVFGRQMNASEAPTFYPPEEGAARADGYTRFLEPRGQKLGCPNYGSAWSSESHSPAFGREPKPASASSPQPRPGIHFLSGGKRAFNFSSLRAAASASASESPADPQGEPSWKRTSSINPSMARPKASSYLMPKVLGLSADSHK